MATRTLPTVDQIFSAGIPQDQIGSLQFFNPNVSYPSAADASGLLYPAAFTGDLYYNMSFLFPEFPQIPDILDCTPNTCSLLLGDFLYLPNVAANVFFAGLFGVVLVTNIILSIRGKTWSHLVGMTGGLILEILGYIGRIMISHDDFSSGAFYIYIICLTIGPAFLSASIYLCLARIIGIYGQHLSRFKPKTYTKIFITSDFISLLLQAAGGGTAASTKTGSSANHAGINIMIAGLAFQVVSLTIFMSLCADFAFRVWQHRDEMEHQYRTFRSSGKFKVFQAALAIATVTIFIRSIFRVAELQLGFQSKFANNETAFMVLEGAMISIAVIAMTAFHPTIVFGRLWRDALIKTKRDGLEDFSSTELTQVQPDRSTKYTIVPTQYHT